MLLAAIVCVRSKCDVDIRGSIQAHLHSRMLWHGLVEATVAVVCPARHSRWCRRWQGTQVRGSLLSSTCVCIVCVCMTEVGGGQCVCVCVWMCVLWHGLWM